MKKYELLEKAMNDYPKGTTFFTIGGGGQCPVVSTGKFKINQGTVQHVPDTISDIEHIIMVFNGSDWARIKNDSIKLFGDTTAPVTVTLDGIVATKGDMQFKMTDQELIEVYRAYQSLLPF